MEDFHFKRIKQHEKELDMLLKKHNKEFEDLQDRIKFSEEEFNRKKKKQETPLLSKFKNKIKLINMK